MTADRPGARESDHSTATRHPEPPLARDQLAPELQARLRVAIARRVEQPAAPDDELRDVLEAIVLAAQADGLESGAVMQAFLEVLETLLPHDDVRRRRDLAPVRAQLVTMLLRTYYAVEGPRGGALAPRLAACLHEERTALAARWLDRISARVTLDPNRVFPTDELLDHVPLLVDGVADYLADPSHSLHADAPVLAAAMDLGELRHAQGFDAYEIAKEFEIFGGVLFAYVARVVDRLDPAASRGELVACLHRLFQAVSLIQQATTARYLQHQSARTHEREQRLRTIGAGLDEAVRPTTRALLAALGSPEVPGSTATSPADAAAASTSESTSDPDAAPPIDPARVLASPHSSASSASLSAPAPPSVQELAASLEQQVDMLALLAQPDDTRRQRHVLLADLVAEVARQMRAAAVTRGVDLRVGTAIPAVEVHAAAIEMALRLAVGRAIGRAAAIGSPVGHEPTAWVEIRGALSAEWGAPTGSPSAMSNAPTSQRTAGRQTREVLLEVWDNGPALAGAGPVTGSGTDAMVEAVTAVAREAEAAGTDTRDTDADRAGLEQRLVMDALALVGGRAWVRTPDDLTVQAFTWPVRRTADVPLALPVPLASGARPDARPELQRP